jgi:hypothetical protein
MATRRAGDKESGRQGERETRRVGDKAREKKRIDISSEIQKQGLGIRGWGLGLKSTLQPHFQHHLSEIRIPKTGIGD